MLQKLPGMSGWEWGGGGAECCLSCHGGWEVLLFVMAHIRDRSLAPLGAQDVQVQGLRPGDQVHCACPVLQQGQTKWSGQGWASPLPRRCFYEAVVDGRGDGRAPGPGLQRSWRWGVF